MLGPRSLETHMMNRFSSSCQTDQLMERVLELSADAQIKRRQSERDSLTYLRLAGAVAAYGRVLRLLSKLQELQEASYLILGSTNTSVECPTRPL